MAETNTNNKDGSSSSGSVPAETSLHDLIKTFQSEVKQSNWLKNNTADKWELENPELAKQYRDALTTTSKINNPKIPDTNNDDVPEAN